MTRVPPSQPAGAAADREYRERLPTLKVDIALRRVFGTRDGRAVFRWLLSDTGLMRSSFSTNALQMAFNEGRRSVGQALSERLQRVSRDDYLLMQDEQDE